MDEKKELNEKTGMDPVAKRNGIIMIVIMIVMIVGGYFWGQAKKAQLILDRADKISAVVEKVMPTEEEAKVNIENAKQTVTENAKTAKVSMEETRQKLNGALDTFKSGDISINFSSKDKDTISQP